MTAHVGGYLSMSTKLFRLQSSILTQLARTCLKSAFGAVVQWSELTKLKLGRRSRLQQIGTDLIVGRTSRFLTAAQAGFVLAAHRLPPSWGLVSIHSITVAGLARLEEPPGPQKATWKNHKNQPEKRPRDWPLATCTRAGSICRGCPPFVICIDIPS